MASARTHTWFSVEIKQSRFPTPAKTVEKSGFRTENTITLLSRIRLTTTLKAHYITFEALLSGWVPTNRYKVKLEIDSRLLRLHIFRGYIFSGLPKKVKLGNFTFTIKFSSESGDPNNLGMSRKNKWVPGSKWFDIWRTMTESGIWGFHGFSYMNRATPDRPPVVASMSPLAVCRGDARRSGEREHAWPWPCLAGGCLRWCRRWQGRLPQAAKLRQYPSPPRHTQMSSRQVSLFTKQYPVQAADR